MSSMNTPEQARMKQGVAGVFGRSAPTYDQVGPRFFSHFGRRLVELAQIAPGSSVLDVATGRGAVLLPAAESVGPRGRVVGIDLSEDMVRLTAAELARRGLPADVSVRVMDAEALDFPDGSFDAVLCGFGIFFFPRLSAALSEFRRVLRPNGRIAVTTWGKADNSQWKGVDDLFDAYRPPDLQSDAAAEVPTPPRIDFETPEGLTAILAEAGFQQVQVLQEDADFAYATEEDLWSTWWSHGMRRTLEQIEQVKGADGLQQFKAEVFRRVAELRQPDGFHERFQALVGLGTKAGD